MTPRRLIPYVVVFLVMVGVLAGLYWQQQRKERLEQQTKRVADFKVSEISTISLKRMNQEIQLSRQGAAWEITKPLKAKADPSMMDSLLIALTELKKERNLGPGDLKAYGLDPPSLLVSFTAKGEQHQVALGQLAPGARSYYARKDEDPNVFLIATTSYDSLNQKLSALRHKTLVPFNPEQVQSIKIKTDKTEMALEKTGPHAWRWVGRDAFRVNSERTEQFLRLLQGARILDFPPAPKDLAATGLAPRAKTEVTLVTPQGAQTLYLGGVSGTGVYARQGTQGEVVLVNKTLPEQIANSIANLEDRRLWAGTVDEVGKVVWGPLGKTWTAVRREKDWILTGPDKAELRQPSQLLEHALHNLKNLEYSSLLPPNGAGQGQFVVEVLSRDDKSLFRLEELGKKGDGVEVRAKSGDATVMAVIPQKNFAQWQTAINRLTPPPPKPGDKTSLQPAK
jgi:hypothetical protein